MLSGMGRGAFACVVGAAWSLASQAGAQIYVNHAATGANDGTSWEDAFTSLHDALAEATDERSVIYVAAGVYRPADAGVFYDRTRAFTIITRATIYGGYSQGPDGVWVQNVDGTPTVLDGDLLGDDGPDFANRSDNSIHVLHQRPDSGQYGSHSVLWGLYIRGGNADGYGDTSEGGGVFCNAEYIRLVKCRIYDNQAVWRGGGVSVNWGAAFVWCERTIFAGNDAPLGSAYCAVQGSSSLCIYTGNGVRSGGAAVWSMAHHLGSATQGCTFVGNPGGALLFGQSEKENTSSDLVLSSILWNNGPVPIETSRRLSVRYSDFQGGFSGEGNIDADPRFVDALGPDGLAGTLDDNFRLASDSPCVNAGFDFRAGFDLDARLRVQHCAPDIGPYESNFFPDCDASGISDDCEIQDPTLDSDGDGRLDRCDEPPPGPNGNENDNGAEPPPSPNDNANDNGVEPPSPTDNSNSNDQTPSDGTEEADPETPADAFNPGVCAPCGSSVGLTTAILFAVHLGYAQNRRRRQRAALRCHSRDN